MADGVRQENNQRYELFECLVFGLSAEKWTSTQKIELATCRCIHHADCKQNELNLPTFHQLYSEKVQVLNSSCYDIKDDPNGRQYSQHPRF